MSEVGLVAVARFAAFHLAGKEFANLLLLHSNGRKHNVYGFATEHLQDTFAQVGFENLNALFSRKD